MITLVLELFSALLFTSERFRQSTPKFCFYVGEEKLKNSFLGMISFRKVRVFVNGQILSPEGDNGSCRFIGQFSEDSLTVLSN